MRLLDWLERRRVVRAINQRARWARGRCTRCGGPLMSRYQPAGEGGPAYVVLCFDCKRVVYEGPLL